MKWLAMREVGCRLGPTYKRQNPADILPNTDRVLHDKTLVEALQD